jgi:hypothetical protein
MPCSLESISVIDTDYFELTGKAEVWEGKEDCNYRNNNYGWPKVAPVHYQQSDSSDPC